MTSIEKVKASDGSGNASVATISNSRSPLASTILVDTVEGINPDGFMASMGTPHTFVDPITAETITVISEETCVDFSGHVDGSNLEIDEIAPGYTDAGSSSGDIVIIRPTTQYADNVAAVLAVSHDDDGSVHATRPKIITSVDDANGNELIKLAPTASAVNELTVGNATAGSPPYLQATGGDTNIDILFIPKGTGVIKGVAGNLDNPYKFSVYNTSSWNWTAATVPFNTELYDTNNNFDTSTHLYTAPVSGFYHFDAAVQAINPTVGTVALLSICVNGTSETRRLQEIYVAVQANYTPSGGTDLQLTAGDTVRITVRNNDSISGGTTASTCWFSGHLISRT